MKNLRSIPFLTVFLFALFSFKYETTAPDETYDSLAVTKIAGLTNEQFAKIDEAFNEDANANIEYYCLWADIVVIKISNSKMAERGDVVTFIRAKITAAIGAVKVEFLDVHISAKGSSKC